MFSHTILITTTNSNKYSRKLVNLKLLILLMYSANFYFVTVLT
jgi:hypothetical protein